MVSRGGLHFPIKLRCADPSVLLTAPGLSHALTRALGRSFSRAVRSLGPEAAFGDGVRLEPAKKSERAGAANPLDPDQWSRLLARINASIEAAALAQPLPRAALRQSLLSPDTGTADTETLDPQRLDPVTALYEIPSYRGGKRKVPVKAVVNPLEQLLQAYDALITSARALHAISDAVRNPTEIRINVSAAIMDLVYRMTDESDLLDQVGQIYLNKLDPRSFTEGAKDKIRPFVARYFDNMFVPIKRNIALREEQIQTGLILAAVIRAHVIELDGRVATLTDPTQLFLMQATMDVGTYYLEAVLLLPDQARERIGFLESFYANPDHIALYAVLRWASIEYTEKLKPNLPTTIPSIKKLISDAYLVAFARGQRIERMLYSSTGEAIHGDLPRSQMDIKNLPDRDLAARLSAEILQLQVELPVLVWWSVVEQLFIALSGDSAGSDADREEWFQKIHDLEALFAEEVKQRDHTKFIKRAQTLDSEINELHRDIYKAIRNLAIRRLIIEQIPLLFVGAGFATAVGAWVEIVANGSRWVVVLAEGAALTVFNGVFTPSDQRPGSVFGWALQFGENVLFAKAGQIIGAFAKGSGEIAQKLTGVRRLLLTGGVITGTVVANSLIQTAVKQIEDAANQKEGETSFTQMLSINVVLNVMGLLFGAAVNTKRNPAPPEVFLSLPREEQVARLTESWQVTDEVVQRWLNLRDRNIEIKQRFSRLAQAAREGTLSKEAFEQWRRDGLEFARDLLDNLDLVEVMANRDTRDQTKAMLESLIAGLQAMNYDSVVRPVPQLTAGLTQVGDGTTFVYDPKTIRLGQLKLLRSSFENVAGNTVTDLPGGGWEVQDASGQVRFQALPAAAEVILKLPPSLDVLAKSDTAKLGLARISGGAGEETGLGFGAQSSDTIPELRSQLAESAASDPDAVNRLLQLAGRGEKGLSKSALQGISNYLRRGGKVSTLARAAIIRDYNARPIESRLHAENVLNNMAGWGDSAVQGLELMLNVVRQRTPTTSDARGSLETLFATVEPEIIKGAMEAVTELAPVTRGLGQVLTPLLSGNPYNERGGVGALLSGVQLAERYPGKIIAFEVPKITPEGFKRFLDIVVIDPATADAWETEIASFEIKEVSTLQLGNRAPHELAVDIRLESVTRSEQQASGLPVTERLGSIRWRIRELNIRQIAVAQLAKEGITAPSNDVVRGRMNDYVRAQLRKAFADPALKAFKETDPAEFKAYQDKFENDLSFVEYF